MGRVNEERKQIIKRPTKLLGIPNYSPIQPCMRQLCVDVEKFLSATEAVQTDRDLLSVQHNRVGCGCWKKRTSENHPTSHLRFQIC